jgi:hypothetical protein
MTCTGSELYAHATGRRFADSEGRTTVHEAPAADSRRCTTMRPGNGVYPSRALRIEPAQSWQGLNAREFWRYRELLYFFLCRQRQRESGSRGR